MRSQWGAIANTHSKVLTHPAPPSPTPGALPQQQNEHSVQYVFYLLFVRTHTKFGIKILEFDSVTKRGRCIKGRLWPPLEPKTESCFSPISSYWFIRRMAQV